MQISNFYYHITFRSHLDLKSRRKFALRDSCKKNSKSIRERILHLDSCKKILKSRRKFALRDSCKKNSKSIRERILHLDSCKKILKSRKRILQNEVQKSHEEEDFALRFL